MPSASPSTCSPPAATGAILARLTGDISPVDVRPSDVDVLLVDDDASIRKALTEYLRDEGYRVTVATDGSEALSLLRSSAAPSIILLDLMMPVMTGWQFRIEQRKDPTLAHIPVIALSANSDPEARAIDAGAFLQKPLDLAALSTAMTAIIVRARGERMEHKDRLAALGTLTAGVAHEIGNPLTCVLSNLGILAQRLPTALARPDADISDMVDDALEAARRMAEIIQHIRTVARTATDEAVTPVDLRAIVEHAMRIVGREVRKRAHVLLNLAETPQIAANPRRLEQVVINLLMNAAHAVADAAPSHPTISINTLTTRSGRARLEVVDTGPGVPATIAGRIFEPFFTTKAVGLGTGLGLSICRAIVEDARGEIGLEQPPSGGALFWIELPAGGPPAGRTV